MELASGDLQLWITAKRRDILEMADLCEKLLFDRSNLEAQNEVLIQEMAQLKAENELLLERLRQSEEVCSLKDQFAMQSFEALQSQLHLPITGATTSALAEGEAGNINISNENSSEATKDVVVKSEPEQLPDLEQQQLKCEMVQPEEECFDVNSAALSDEPTTSASWQAQNSALNAALATAITTGPPSSEAYVCRYCGRTFGSTTGRIHHEFIHTGERPYPCNICGRRFNQPGNRDIHVRRHLKDYRYSCEGCGEKFITKRNLEYHRCTSFAVTYGTSANCDQH